MTVLTFGFTGWDYKESPDLEEILRIAEKIGKGLRYTSFDTGGTYYDYAIHNDVVDTWSEKERDILPQFFLDVLFNSGTLEEIKIEKKDGVYAIPLEAYRLYMAKIDVEEDDWF